MAVNSSGKPPVNSLGENDDFGLADLGRIADQYHTEPASIRAARHRREKAQKVISTIEELEQQNPGTTSLPIFQKELLRNTRVRGSVNSRLDIYQESKQDRLNDQATNMVSRNLSSSAVNSYVTRNSNSLEAQVSGMAMTGQGYASLNTQRTQIMGQMQGLRQDSISAAGSYIDQGGINKGSASVLQSGSDQMKDLAKQLIPITTAMLQLKQQGLDPKGRQEELARIGNRASNVLQSNQLQEDMKSGMGLGANSMGELKKKEADAAERLIKAFTALNSAAGKSADELNELHEGAEAAAKDFEDIRKAKEEKGKGGGDGNKYETIKMVAGTIMQALSLGTAAYQNVAINQPMQMVSNTAASANLENQKYDSWHAALAGNIHERMNLDWTDARAFGNTMANAQSNVHTLQTGNYTVGGVLGATQVGLSVANAVTSAGGAVSGVNPIGQGAEGALNVASSFGGLVVNNAAQKRQTDMTPLRIEGAIAYQNARKALSKISGKQGQAYRDYAMGINETAGAMGGEVGEAFMNRVGSADFLKSLSKEDIGAKEFNALSLKGVQQMGSQFNEKQIFDATKLEKRGYGTAEQNMQRMGTLAAAGQGDSAGNLGKIIEEAMQRGLNSSKALDMIVENTAKFAEAGMLAGAATDPSVGIATAILRAVDQSNPNKELALKQAQQGFDQGETAMTNTAASLAGFQNVDRNMKVFGVDRKSAQILTGLSTAEIEGLKGIKAPNKDEAGKKLTDEEKVAWEEASRKDYLSRLGINTSTLKKSWLEGNNLPDALDDTGASAVLAGTEGRGIAWGTSNAYKELLKKSRGNEELSKTLVFGGKGLRDLSPEDLRIYENQMASRKVGGVNGAPEAAKAAVKMGLFTEEVSAKKLKDLQTKMRENAVKEGRLGRKADSAQTAVGAEAFGSTAASAMAALAESGRIAFEKMSEKAWSKAASDTASKFGDSSSLMGSAASKLEDAAGEMTRNTQLMAASGATFAKAVSDAIDNIAAKLGMINTAPTNQQAPSDIIARVVGAIGGPGGAPNHTPQSVKTGHRRHSQLPAPLPAPTSPPKSKIQWNSFPAPG